jgi:lambda family phage tail tape measure protein
MSDVIGKGVIEVSADSTKLKAGIEDAKRSIRGLGGATTDASKRASDSIDRYVKRLQVQAATLGKSAREVELYKLSLRGASREQIAAADAALRMAEGYERGAAIGARLRAGFLLLGAAVATGLVAAAAAFDGLIKKAGDFQDMGEKVGDTGENIASLAVAAGTAGASMDTVVSASQRLTKGLTGVDDESKAAGAAISALGLSLSEFKALAPADQFETVAKALAGFEDGAGKTAVAMALFGKSGAELLPFLKELGQEGGRQNILTAEQIRLADEYSDRQAKLRAQIGLHAQAIATELLPALNDLTSTVADLAKDQEFAAVASDLLKGALNGAIVVFQTIAVVASDVGFVFKGVGREIGGILAQLDRLAVWDFKGFSAISDAVREDATKARAELDRFQARIMSIGQPKTIGQEASFQSLEDRRLGRPAATGKRTLNFSGAVKTGKTGGSPKDTAAQEAKEQLRADLQAIKDASIARLAAFDTAETIMEARRSAALVDERTYYESKRAFVRLDAQEKDRALKAEVARLEQEQLTGKDAIANKREIAQINAQIARIAEDAAGKLEVLAVREAEAVRKVAAAYEDAKDSASEYLYTIAQRNDREIEGIGQGDRARGQRQEVNVIEDKFLEEKNRLDRDLRRGDITADQYRKYLQIAREAYAQEIALYEDRTRKMDGAQGDWVNGYNESVANYLDTVRNVAAESQNLFDGVFGTLEDAFADFATTGKGSFKDLLNAIAADITRFAARQVLGDLLGGLKGQMAWGEGVIASIASAVGLRRPDASNAPGGRNFGMDLGREAVSGAPSVASAAAATAQEATRMATISASTAAITADTVARTAGTAAESAATAAISTASASSSAALASLTAAASSAAAALGTIAASSAMRSGASALGSLGSLASGAGFFNDAGGLEVLGSLGFSAGGYTGDTAPNKAAGVVHGQEYVFSAPAVRTIGRTTLEAIHQKAARGDASALDAAPASVIARAARLSERGPIAPPPDAAAPASGRESAAIVFSAPVARPVALAAPRDVVPGPRDVVPAQAVRPSYKVPTIATAIEQQIVRPVFAVAPASAVAYGGAGGDAHAVGGAGGAGGHGAAGKAAGGVSLTVAAPAAAAPIVAVAAPSVAVFAGAAKYHAGGRVIARNDVVPGLQANEVPAILLRNEEVLTREDPRHRDNIAPALLNRIEAAPGRPTLMNIIASGALGGAGGAGGIGGTGGDATAINGKDGASPVAQMLRRERHTRELSPLTRFLIGSPATVSSLIRELSKESEFETITQLRDLPVSGSRALGGTVSAGGLYEVNERGPELLSVAGKEYLMVGDSGGKVAPVAAGAPGATEIINVSVAMPAGASRDTAMQFGSAVARQLRVSTRRNG